MYTPGNIIYFTPFYFSNGNPCKPKYFIVLNVVDNTTVLLNLPTRSDNLPNNIDKTHGCIELPEGNINCYLIEKGKEIAENGFFFKFNTHLYGYYIDQLEIEYLNSIYSVEGQDYTIVGRLINEEFNAIIECFKESKTVKRKYKKYL
jgi:hypothetical protein